MASFFTPVIYFKHSINKTFVHGCASSKDLKLFICSRGNRAHIHKSLLVQRNHIPCTKARLSRLEKSYYISQLNCSFLRIADIAKEVNLFGDW